MLMCTASHFLMRQLATATVPHRRCDPFDYWLALSFRYASSSAAAGRRIIHGRNVPHTQPLIVVPQPIIANGFSPFLRCRRSTRRSAQTSPGRVIRAPPKGRWNQSEAE